MMVFLLGVGDVLVALNVLYPEMFAKLLHVFSIFYSITKGSWSIFSSAGVGHYFDLMGWLDIVAGIILILIRMGMAFDFFYTIGICLLIKGIYSLLVGLFI
jgi:hypothetical protein